MTKYTPKSNSSKNIGKILQETKSRKRFLGRN
jgi:hypothetical protein